MRFGAKKEQCLLHYIIAREPASPWPNLRNPLPHFTTNRKCVWWLDSQKHTSQHDINTYINSLFIYMYSKYPHMGKSSLKLNDDDEAIQKEELPFCCLCPHPHVVVVVVCDTVL